MPFRITTKNVLQFTWRRRTVDSAKEKLKDLKDKFSTPQVVGRHSHTNSPLLTMKYSRKFPPSLRSSVCTPCPQVLGELNSLGVLRYRGGKGGKKTRGNYLQLYLNIFSRTTRRDYANFGYLQAPLPLRGVNLKNLIKGTQRQFSENICSEDDLRSRIFWTFFAKFLASLRLQRFLNT